jgi:hypothetical protein
MSKEFQRMQKLAGLITATKKAGFKYVIGVLRGRQKTASGYKWKYKN